MQMVLWSVVAASQFLLSGRASFLACRCILGVLQGGFIPDVVLYLSYFYKHNELSIRLGFFWTAMVFADIFAAFSAFALLHMRGVLGYSGWRWLFLVEVSLRLLAFLAATGLTPGGGGLSPGLDNHGVWRPVVWPDAGWADADGQLVQGEGGLVQH